MGQVAKRKFSMSIKYDASFQTSHERLQVAFGLLGTGVLTLRNFR